MGRIVNPTNKTISEQMAKILDSGKKAQSWMHPINLSRLQAAVAKDADEVVLDGIKYDITYGYQRTYPASNETVDYLKLKRADGQFVPFGYVSLKRIREFKFEEGE